MSKKVMKKPVLTIGMIVKNEIRCLERCLKALQPLRDAIPSELIIADTGSDDGTREIAEKYADEVFDFIWVSDFSAARNAVMDRARGEWYLSIDADEYLDENIAELLVFFQKSVRRQFVGCSVVVRNYVDEALTIYSDFLPMRLVRMDTGVRYTGAIHEVWKLTPDMGEFCLLDETVFHHDGYVSTSEKRKSAKRDRNMELLREVLKQDPENLWRVNQCIESSGGEPEQLEFIREGIRLVRKKVRDWNIHGPFIFWHAVSAARSRKLPEFWDWVEEAEQLFPQALATRFNVYLLAFYQAEEEGQDEKAIRYGEAYLKMAKDYESENFKQGERMIGVYDNGPAYQILLCITLADVYCRQKEYEKSRDLLEKIDLAQMLKEHVGAYLDVLLKLQAQSSLELQNVIVPFWKMLLKPESDELLRLSKQKAQESFTTDFREQEEKEPAFVRHGYTLFKPLRGICELGAAAHIMETGSLLEIEEILSSVEEWNQLPEPVLVHAQEHGFHFPSQPGGLVLTIGMIVKNEIRCLEKCLQALTPLREALPCELIIADTGSDDGTREIAEKYADEVFDFAWVDDFSAARNAVMDKAQGRWYLSIDADEYLDEDIAELLEFFQGDKQNQFNQCSVLVRNYHDRDRGERYDDFLALRMLRMDTGLRYRGAIHETWPAVSGKTKIGYLSRTMLHHDGYVKTGGKGNAAKAKRNMAILKEELQKNPEDIRRINQCIESSVGTTEHLTFIREGLRLVRKKIPLWDIGGPIVFQHAVSAAKNGDLPEFWEWVQEAESLFPQSLCTRFNVYLLAFSKAAEEEKYATEIHYGEAYLKMVSDYEQGNFDRMDMMLSAFSNEPFYHNLVRITLADVYCRQKDFEKSRERLEKVDLKSLAQEQVGSYLGALLTLQAKSNLVLDDLIVSFWEEISKPGVGEKKEGARKRLQMAFAAGNQSFTKDFREKEAQEEGFIRHGYTLFLPLLGRSELGAAASVMEAETLPEMEEALATVEKWERFPAPALARALAYGFDFPPQPLLLEELDALALRLADVEEDYLQQIVAALPIPEAIHDLNWVRALIHTAVTKCRWEEKEEDSDKYRMLLLQKFAALEVAWLSRCHTPEVLNEAGVYGLSVLHRFGWYLAQAFEAKNRGNVTGYIQLLKKALASCEGMKGAVEFLLRQFEKEQENPEMKIPPELFALAEQVKMMLAMYPPEHPMVVQIKSSPAYQQVAFLIEGNGAG